MFKNRILCLILLFMISGCVSLSIQRTLLDGSVLKATYLRIGDQSLDGLVFESKGNWRLSIERQLSETEIAFQLGVASINVGGSNK